MKLIVGLGNPGKKYEKSRHNVGFMVVDRLVASGWKKSKSGLVHFAWIGSKVEVIKPQTFMNRSGEAVAYAVGKHSLKLENLYVIHDDLDIALGEYKIQQGKGPKIHNGLNSVTEKLKSENYWRVRVGIENRGEGDKIPGRAYVLQKFSIEEEKILNDAMDSIVEEIKRVF